MNSTDKKEKSCAYYVGAAILHYTPMSTNWLGPIHPIHWCAKHLTMSHHMHQTKLRRQINDQADADGHQRWTMNALGCSSSRRRCRRTCTTQRHGSCNTTPRTSYLSMPQLWCTGHQLVTSGRRPFPPTWWLWGEPPSAAQHWRRRESPSSSWSTLRVDRRNFSSRVGFERAEKIYVISGQKNPAHDHPTGRIRTQFSGWARAGPGLGRAAHAFYSVKQLKTEFQAGVGPKIFFTGFKITTHARPVRFVGRHGVGRAQAGPVGRVSPGSKCSGIAASNVVIKFVEATPSVLKYKAFKGSKFVPKYKAS
jgi:hypothetical protein